VSRISSWKSRHHQLRQLATTTSVSSDRLRSTGDGDTCESVIITPLVFVVYLSCLSSHVAPVMAAAVAAANQPQQTPPAYATRQKIIRVSLLTPFRCNCCRFATDTPRMGAHGMALCDQAASPTPADERMTKPGCDVA